MVGDDYYTSRGRIFRRTDYTTHLSYVFYFFWTCWRNCFATSMIDIFIYAISIKEYFINMTADSIMVGTRKMGSAKGNSTTICRLLSDQPVYSQ